MIALHWNLLSLALFVLCSSIVVGVGDCLNISPVTEKGTVQFEDDRVGGDINGYYSHVNVTGLVGLESEEWTRLETIEIQLVETSPVWTIHNLRPSFATIQNGNLQYFAGQSDDGLITCNLALFTSPVSGASSFVGRVEDREEGIYYKLKPNVEGEDTVSVHQIDWHENKTPSSSDANDNPNFSFWDIWNTLGVSGLTKEIVLNPFLAASKRGWFRGHEEDTEMVEIDVMVVWSVNAECENSGLSLDCVLDETTRLNMEAMTEFMVLESNLVHENSGTGVRISLVHAERDQSGYTENSSQQALQDLALPLVDGKLNYIQPLRNKYKADLVTYIYDINLDSDFNCGVAIPTNAPGLFLPSFPLSCLGYSVVASRCMIGYTAAHEWGHNMGCHHDRGTTNDESYELGTGCLLDKSICDGTADTSYGWRSPAGTFRTVMAYSCRPGQCDNYQGNGNCFTIPYFSGEYNYRNGESLGGEKNNCRKEIMKNKRKIAAFR